MTESVHRVSMMMRRIFVRVLWAENTCSRRREQLLLNKQITRWSKETNSRTLRFAIKYSLKRIEEFECILFSPLTPNIEWITWIILYIQYIDEINSRGLILFNQISTAIHLFCYGANGDFLGIVYIQTFSRSKKLVRVWTVYTDSRYSKN